MTAVEIQKTLEQEIVDGVYDRSRRLPSDNELCHRFGVARGTIRKAVDEIVRKGLAVRRRGSGSFLTTRGALHTKVIGLIIPEYSLSTFFKYQVDAFVRVAKRFGYQVKLVETSEQKIDARTIDLRRKVRQLVADRVEGVVFRPLGAEDGFKCNLELARILTNAKVPLVLLNRDFLSPPERSELDLITVDNTMSGRVLARHFVRRKYQRVAFLFDSRHNNPNSNFDLRLFGIAGELAVNGCTNAVRKLKFAPSDESAVKKLLKSAERPSVIACGNDEIAVELVRTVTRLGLRVPEDVAVTGFDDLPCARESVPPLTTVHQPLEAIAETALRTLFARIHNPGTASRVVSLFADIVERRSTAK